MTPNRQRKLNLKETKEFDIPKGFEAFIFSLDKVIEERCDEFDYQLEDQGYEIVHREFKRVATSIYNYEVVAYK